VNRKRTSGHVETGKGVTVLGGLWPWSLGGWSLVLLSTAPICTNKIIMEEAPDPSAVSSLCLTMALPSSQAFTNQSLTRCLPLS
jgi:hypothetical protein